MIGSTGLRFKSTMVGGVAAAPAEEVI